MPRKVVFEPLPVPTVEDRNVALESLPSLMSFEAAVALDRVTLEPFWSMTLLPGKVKRG
jgi:hypothetical protein